MSKSPLILISPSIEKAGVEFGDQLKIVFTVLALLIEQMMSEVMLQPLIGGQLQYFRCKQAGTLADNPG